MYKPFIKKLKNSLIGITACAILMPVVNAEKFNVDQEIKISSSRQAADLKNKIFSYIDNVIISQGSLTINAELVQVITQNESDNKVYIAKGSPATFEQTLEEPHENIYISPDSQYIGLWSTQVASLIEIRSQRIMLCFPPSYCW